jgi:hypothetical protein
MNTEGLEQRLVALWQEAAEDLGIRVTAPVELLDASDRPFTCEALVHDFGSWTGAVVVSPKSERRVRANLRTLENKLWVSGSEQRLTGYSRKRVMEELLDWGWFGEPGAEPQWYSKQVPSSR